MRARSNQIAIVVAALVSLALTGCSGSGGAPLHHTARKAVSSPSSAADTATSGPAPTQISKPTETPTPSAENLSYDSRDADGYTYHLVVQAPGTINIATDVASQKPGQIALSLDFAIQGTITNTTEGRDTPVGDSSLMPVWSPSSPVCTDSSGSPSAIETGNASTGYCTIGAWHIGIQDGRQPATLAPDESTPIGLNTTSIYSTRGIQLIAPETQKAAVTDSFAHPAFWALSGNLGDPSVSNSEGQCYLPGMPDLIIVATTSAGASVCKAHTGS